MEQVRKFIEQITNVGTTLPDIPVKGLNHILRTLQSFGYPRDVLNIFETIRSALFPLNNANNTNGSPSDVTSHVDGESYYYAIQAARKRNMNKMALMYYNEMVNLGIRPTEPTFIAILEMLAKTKPAATSKLVAVFEQIRERFFGVRNTYYILHIIYYILHIHICYHIFTITIHAEAQ